MEALASVNFKLMQGLSEMNFSLPRAKVSTTHLGKSMNFDLIEAKKSNFECKLWLNGSFGLISMKIHQHFHLEFHKGCIQNRILLLDKYFQKSMFYIV